MPPPSFNAHLCPFLPALSIPACSSLVLQALGVETLVFGLCMAPSVVDCGRDQNLWVLLLYKTESNCGISNKSILLMHLN